MNVTLVQYGDIYHLIMAIRICHGSVGNRESKCKGSIYKYTYSLLDKILLAINYNPISYLKS